MPQPPPQFRRLYAAPAQPEADVVPSHADPRPQGHSRATLQGPDLLRAVATIAVIVIHATAWPAYSHAYATTNMLMRFSVPAFVLLAGLVIGYGYSDRHLGVRFLGRRLRRSLLPWLVWAPLYLAFSIWIGDLAGTGTAIAQWFEAGAGHLYFLLIIPQLYLIFYIWPRGHRWWWAAAALVLQAGVSLFRLSEWAGSYWVDWFTLWYGFLYFPYWIGYFAVGVATARELSPRGRRFWWALAAAGLATVITGWALIEFPWSGPLAAYANGTGGFIAPLMIPFSLAASSLILLLAPPLARHLGPVWAAIRSLGRHSLGIYIIHPALLDLAGHVVGTHEFSRWVTPWWGITILVLLLLGASWLLSWLISLTPAALSVGETWRRPGHSRAA